MLMSKVGEKELLCLNKQKEAGNLATAVSHVNIEFLQSEAMALPLWSP